MWQIATCTTIIGKADSVEVMNLNGTSLRAPMPAIVRVDEALRRGPVRPSSALIIVALPPAPDAQSRAARPGFLPRLHLAQAHVGGKLVAFADGALGLGCARCQRLLDDLRG